MHTTTSHGDKNRNSSPPVISCISCYFFVPVSSSSLILPISFSYPLLSPDIPSQKPENPWKTYLKLSEFSTWLRQTGTIIVKSHCHLSIVLCHCRWSCGWRRWCRTDCVSERVQPHKSRQAIKRKRKIKDRNHKLLHSFGVDLCNRQYLIIIERLPCSLEHQSEYVHGDNPVMA